MTNLVIRPLIAGKQHVSDSQFNARLVGDAALRWRWRHNAGVDLRFRLRDWVAAVVPRRTALRGGRRRLVASGLAAVLVLSMLVLVSVEGERSAAAAEPPPGGLVPSAAEFGWTEGEFSVSGDGAARYSVPLWTPKGRGESAPNLALSYDSRAGNGVLGVGWSLRGLSSITWCSRTIAQDGFTDGGHFDGADPLCLDGNRLVPLSGPQLPEREYRTERESFARITGFGAQDGVPDYFKVETRNGRILTLGQTPDSRIQPFLLQAGTNLAEPSLVRAPGPVRVTTTWSLNRIEDRNGNATTIEYTRTEGDAAGLWWAHQRPSMIRYAPNRSVRFFYEGRTDPIEAFVGGTHARTDVRMSRIEMWGGPQGTTAELLRQYQLSYRANTITKRSLLDNVSECDHNGTCKLPLTFDYSPGSYQFEPINAGNAGISADVGLITGDIDGDGRGDLLHPDEDGWVVQRGVDTGFGTPVDAGLPQLFANESPRPVDVDADGRIDVVAPVAETQDGFSGYRWRLFQWNGTRFTAAPGDLEGFKRRLGHETADPVYFADFDGNGLPDYASATLTSADEFEPWYFRLNSGATGAGRFTARVDTTRTPSDELPGNNNFVVDSDGDGRAELISMTRPIHPIEPPLAQPGWQGWGLFAGTNQGVEGRNLNIWGHSIRTHFGDVNGDGLEDAVYPYYSTDPGAGRALQVQLNSGNGFGSRRTTTPPSGYAPVDPIPGLDPDYGVRIADFNNDGRDDVLVFHEGTPTAPGDTTRGAQLFVWNDNRLVRAELSQGVGSNAILSWANTQPMDWDGDGALDIVHVGTGGGLTVYRRLGGMPDKLVGVGNTQYRGRVEVTYTTLGDRAVHTPGTCTYPQSCPTTGNSIVKRHRITSDFSTAGAFTLDSYNHFYSAAREDLNGRGWLGFAEHGIVRTATGASNVTAFDNVTRDLGTRTYPFAHLAQRTTYTVRDINNTNGREFQSSVANSAFVRRHTGGTYSVELRTVTATEQERPVGATAWQQLRTNTTQSTFDDFGNIDVVSSTTTNGRKVTVDLEHRNDTGAWQIGLPKRKLMTGCTVAGACTARETGFDYDSRGNHTVTVVEPNKPAVKLTTTKTHDQFGNVTSVSDAANTGAARTDTIEYNDASQVYPTAIVDAVGHRTQVQTHSGLGVPISTTDPNGVKTTRRFDWFGRLRETNHSDGSFERIEHIYFGWQFTTTTVSGGGVTTLVADQLGRERERRVRAFDGRTATTYTNHDSLGRGVWQVSRPALPGESVQYTTTLYDNRGRVRSVTAPDGAQQRRTYLNREVHTFDAKGVESYTAATVDGQVESSYEDDPASAGWLRTRFEYGSFGETTRVVAPDGTGQVMAYDVLGRQERLADPSSGTTVAAYNAFDEMTTVTDGSNRTSTFEYDALGRVRKETSADGVTTNVWDTAAGGKGLLARATSADGVVTAHTYEFGKPATTRWTIDGTAYEIGLDYDDTIGRLASVEYPAVPGATGRLKVNHVYNPHGYLSRVSDAADATAYWTAAERNGAGQLTRERYGNGVETTRAYQASTGLLTAITTTGPGAAGTLGLLSYGYDPNRNVTGKVDWVNGRGETHGYDQLDRLKTWTATTAQLQVSAAYTYDSVGNLKTETVTGVPNQNATYTYGENGAPPHALTSRNSQNYGYDGAGRQTSGPQRTIEYNRMGLPKAINWGIGQGGGQRTEFAYDATGAQARKRDANQTILTVGGLFERRLTAGTGGGETHNLHNIVVEGRVVAQINRVQAASGGPVTATRPWYLHADRQGSTVLVTNRNGEPVGEDESWLRQLLYDPFGRRIDAGYAPLNNSTRGGPRQGYTGHLHDDEYGLINMIGRIYDPQARRFISPDPIIQDRLSSQNYNRYAYVQNNPVTKTDPTGFQTAGGGSSDDDSSAIEVDCTDCVSVITYPPNGPSGPGLLGAMLVEFAFMSMQFMAQAEAEMLSWMSGYARPRAQPGPPGPAAGASDTTTQAEPSNASGAEATSAAAGLLTPLRKWFERYLIGRAFAKLAGETGMPSSDMSRGGMVIEQSVDGTAKTTISTRKQHMERAVEKPSTRPGRGLKIRSGGGPLILLEVIGIATDQIYDSDWALERRARQNGVTLEEQRWREWCDQGICG